MNLVHKPIFSRHLIMFSKYGLSLFAHQVFLSNTPMKKKKKYLHTTHLSFYPIVTMNQDNYI